MRNSHCSIQSYKSEKNLTAFHPHIHYLNFCTCLLQTLNSYQFNNINFLTHIFNSLIGIQEIHVLYRPDYQQMFIINPWKIYWHISNPNLFLNNVSGQYNLLIAAAAFSNPYKEPSQYMQNVMVMNEKSDIWLVRRNFRLITICNCQYGLKF